MDSALFPDDAETSPPPAAVRPGFRRDALRTIGGAALAGSAYFLAAKVGLLFSAAGFNVSPVWPAAGVAGAALFIGGYRLWPVILVASLVADVTGGVGGAAAAANGAAAVAEAALGAWLLRTGLPFDRRLARVQDVLVLLAVCLIAPLAGALLGVTALTIAEAIPGDYFFSLRLWWFGDATGWLFVAPLLLVFPVARSWTLRQVAELAMFLVITAGTSTLMLFRFEDRFPFTFILLPALITAVRLRQLGAAASATTISIITIAAAIQGEGNPANLPLAEAAVTLQVAVAAGAVTVLLVAAVLREREEAETRAGLILEAAADGIFGVDKGGRTTFVNTAAQRLVGRSARELIGRRTLDGVHPSRSDGPPYPMRESPTHQTLADGVSRTRVQDIFWRSDGTWFPAEVSTGPILDPNSEVAGAVVSFTDVSERSRAEAEREQLEDRLRHQALHDPLTNLPNRALFKDRLAHAQDRRAAAPLAVLFLDLDDFKTINDTLGHEAGDYLLVEAAARLCTALRPGDTVARLGGDEFAILLEDAATEEAGELVARRILGSLARPFELANRNVTVSGSIGIAAADSERWTAEEFLRNADVAMYAAKTEAKGRYVVFHEEMHAAVLHRVQLESEIRRGIDRGEFVVRYQPILHLARGEIIGAEALARWEHPDRGMVSPAEFIPVAEDTGLIVALGRSVLRQACEQLRRWLDEEAVSPTFHVGVNLSAKQIREPTLVGEVADALRGFSIPPAALVLEITETLLMERSDEIIDKFDELKALGVVLAIDDFGTGYSSLSYLHRFPIDVLKVDRSFTERVALGPEDASFARAIVKLGRNLNMQTVAEGIETAEQLEELQRMRCDFGQGFYFAKPLHAEELADLIRNASTPAGGTDAAGAYFAR